jgi:hypothetical protein
VLAVQRKKITPYAIVSLPLTIQISLLTTVMALGPVYARMYGMTNNAGLSRYSLGLKFIEVIPKYKDDPRPVYFWYSNADKLANSLQSTYLWGYSRLMDSKPETAGLPFLTGVNVELLRQSSSLVLFDRDKKIVDQGIQELHGLGIRFAVNKTREICEKEICYTIAILNVSADNQKFERFWKEGRQLNGALDWGQPANGAKIDREGTTTTVTTPSKAWNYGAVASIVFSEPRSAAHGLVRILVSVKDANAGLGFTGTDTSNFIKRVEIQPIKEAQEVYVEFDNIGELHHLVIHAWDRNKSAKVQILDFSVRSMARSDQ